MAHLKILHERGQMKGSAGPRPSPDRHSHAAEDDEEAVSPTAEAPLKPRYALQTQAEGGGGSPAQALAQAAHCYCGVAALYAGDKALAALCGLLGLTFPSALIGLFLIVPSLLALAHARPAAADATMAFFRPGVEWVAHRWLPIFYIPALVTLPLAIQPLSGVVLGKAVAVVCIGLVLTLACTGQVAFWIRKATGTELMDFPYHSQPIAFSMWIPAAWGCVGLASLLAAAQAPAQASLLAFPFLLAITALGYVGGMSLPHKLHRVVHPVIVCGAAPNLGALLLGAATGEGYWDTLRRYLTKGAGGLFGYGPGDLLFSFLGVIILSFSFKVYEQWPVMQRHAPEILGSTFVSALFSMLSTAGLGRLFVLPPDVARAMVPRSVTMALALPIAAQLDAPQPITAAGVVLTAIVGANFIQTLLNAFRFRDRIARGLTAAATAHGFGTAALAAREPEALPYCALSYAMCGIFATCAASLGPVRSLIQAITG